MSIVSLLLFAGIYAAAVASPGPAVLALIARVLARGSRGVAGFIAGCGIGDLIWLTMAAAGLAVLAQTMQGVFTVIKWAGVAYLIYLAWKLWFAPADPNAKAPKLKADGNWPMLIAGLSLTLSNPKTMVFFLAVLPTVVDLPSLTLLGYFEIMAIMAILVPLIFGAYVLLLLRARSVLLSRFGMQRINRACAMGLAGAAGLVATR